MYPSQDLSQLAAHKTVLQRQIGRHRRELVEAAEIVVLPVRRLDHWIGKLRHYAPWAPVAIIGLGFVMRRKHRFSQWRPILRFAFRGLAILLTTRKVALAK